MLTSSAAALPIGSALGGTVLVLPGLVVSLGA
jgi:hypothetical protein